MSSSLIGDSLSKLTEPLIKVLLKDRTTRKDLIWATDEYEPYGSDYHAKREITLPSISGIFPDIIQPRILKPEELKLQRKRKKAEVFTPSWICNLQNNIVDDDWFGRKNVFNETLNASWKTTSGSIIFPEDPHRSWKKYVDSRRLEITCGEAPYLVSRYDAVTGEGIYVRERIGLLDRKLRIVNENTENESDWFKWAKRAYQSCYGYEYQGDNALLARINLELTFAENFESRWHREATFHQLREIAHIISWNIWQMDGLSYTVPYGVPEERCRQTSVFDLFPDGSEKRDDTQPLCRIMDWRAKRSLTFASLKSTNNIYGYKRA